MAKTKAAVTSFVATVGKGKSAEEHHVRAGDELPASHPVVKARPELFAETETEEAK